MINNRQGGRRRGRGGQRPQNMGGQSGNRQDNRQRGNAAQLLEKYKSMARDAQLAGDRVQTEYYLQYADHYYRVLGESRARFEEQRRARGEDLDEDEGDEEMVDADGDDRDEDQQYDRDDRPQRQERGERQDRGDRGDRQERGERQERPRRYARDDRGDDERPQRQQRNGAERAPVNADRGAAAESIAFDALPPAIGGGEEAAGPGAEVVEARPRRRTRRPRTEEGDGEIAPAA